MEIEFRMKEDKKRLERERDFHNDVFSSDTRESTKKYYQAVQSGKEYYKNQVCLDIAEKKVLEYGCGPGSSTFEIAKHGGLVTGIDISDVAIKQSSEMATNMELDISFEVMDAEELGFSDSEFDLVCGSGILHHLDLERSYSELNRVLKKNGRGIFFEPLGHNPIINLYRLLTPKMRTEDEHPLLMKDIELAKNYFNVVDKKFFNLTSLISSFIPPLSENLNKIDNFLFTKIPYLQKHAWIVVLTLESPIKK